MKGHDLWIKKKLIYILLPLHSVETGTIVGVKDGSAMDNDYTTHILPVIDISEWCLLSLYMILVDEFVSGIP